MIKLCCFWCKHSTGCTKGICYNALSIKKYRDLCKVENGQCAEEFNSRTAVAVDLFGGCWEAKDSKDNEQQVSLS